MSTIKKILFDKIVFKNWYEKLFLKYQKKIQKNAYLLDKSPSHISEGILKEFKNHEKHYVLIPGGITRHFQPLDIGINKIFKNALKYECN